MMSNRLTGPCEEYGVRHGCGGKPQRCHQLSVYNDLFHTLFFDQILFCCSLRLLLVLVGQSLGCSHSYKPNIYNWTSVMHMTRLSFLTERSNPVNLSLHFLSFISLSLLLFSVSSPWFPSPHVSAHPPLPVIVSKKAKPRNLHKPMVAKCIQTQHNTNQNLRIFFPTTHQYIKP